MGWEENKTYRVGDHIYINGQEAVITSVESSKKAEKTKQDVGVIQRAIEAIDEVLNVHENHVYPSDTEALMKAKGVLMLMQVDGFK